MKEKECYLCMTTIGVERHHVFYGRGIRPIVDKYGMVVYLCAQHHRGPHGVHFDRDLDLYFKRMYQQIFEQTHTREEFMRIFKRNYL